MPTMKKLIVVLLFLAVAISCCHSKETTDNDSVFVSPKCAAVLLASSTTLGAGMAYTLGPSTLCAAGFCPAGVAGSSFASWWQSTIPLVVKGSLFAQLQSLAMGGSVSGIGSVAGAAIGGAVGAGYLRDFCAYVDETDPDSTMGKLFTTSVTVVTTAIRARDKLQSHCASSETCAAVTEAVTEAGTATMEMASSMWDSVTTGASNLAKRARLNREIVTFSHDIEKIKNEFGTHVFDYMRKDGSKWQYTEDMYKKSLDKVNNIELEIKDRREKLAEL